MMENKYQNDLFCYINRYNINEIIENGEEKYENEYEYDEDKDMSINHMNENNDICEYEIPFLLDHVDDSNKEDSEKNSLKSYLDDGASTILSKPDELENYNKQGENDFDENNNNKNNKIDQLKEKINIIIIPNKGVINNFEEILSMANRNDKNIEKKLNDRFYQICCKSIADINTHNLNKVKDLKKKKNKGSLNIEHIDYGDIFLTIHDTLKCNNKIKGNNKTNLLHDSSYEIKKKTRRGTNIYKNPFHHRGSYLTSYENQKDIIYLNNLNNIMMDKNNNCSDSGKKEYSNFNLQEFSYDKYSMKDRMFLKNLYMKQNRLRDKRGEYHKVGDYQNIGNYYKKFEHSFDCMNISDIMHSNKMNHVNIMDHMIYKDNNNIGKLVDTINFREKDVKNYDDKVESYNNFFKNNNDEQHICLEYDHIYNLKDTVKNIDVEEEQCDKGVICICDQNEDVDDLFLSKKTNYSSNKKREDYEKVLLEDNLHIKQTPSKRTKINIIRDYDDNNRSNNSYRENEEDALSEVCGSLKNDDILYKDNKLNVINEYNTKEEDDKESVIYLDTDEDKEEEMNKDVYSNVLSCEEKMIKRNEKYNETLNSTDNFEKIYDPSEINVESKEDKEYFDLLIKKYENTKIEIDDNEFFLLDLSDEQHEEMAKGDSNENVNKVEDMCNDNKKGDICYDNMMEDMCNDNIMEDICNDNIMEDICNDNNMEDICNDNIMEDMCNDSIMEDMCNDNIMEDICNDNIMEDICHNNNIEEICHNNNMEEICHNNNMEDDFNYDNEELNKIMDKLKEEREERNDDRGIYDELLENDMCDLYNLKMHDLHNLKAYDFGLSKDLLKKDIFIFSNNLKNDDMDDDNNNNMNDISVGENVIYDNDIHENNIYDNDMYNNYVDGNDLHINNMQDDVMDDIVYDEEEIKSFLDKLKSDISNQMNVKNGNVEVIGKGGNEKMSYINNDENLQAFDLLDNFHMDDYGNDYNDNEEDGDDDEQKKTKQKELHNINGKLNLSDLNELNVDDVNNNVYMSTPRKSIDERKDTECQTDFPLLDISRNTNRTPRRKSVEVILVEKKLKKKKQMDMDKYTVENKDSNRRYPKRNRIKTLRYWIGERELTERNPYTGEIDVVGFSECKNLQDLSPHIIGPIEYKKIYLKDLNSNEHEENEDNNGDIIEDNNANEKNYKNHNNLESEGKGIVYDDVNNLNVHINNDNNDHSKKIKEAPGRFSNTNNGRKKRRKRKFINVVNYIKNKKKKKLIKSMDKVEVTDNFKNDISDDNKQSGDDNKQSGDDNKQSGDDNKQSGDDNKQSDDDNKQSGDDNKQSDDDNKQSGDDNKQSGDIFMNEDTNVFNDLNDNFDNNEYFINNDDKDSHSEEMAIENIQTKSIEQDILNNDEEDNNNIFDIDNELIDMKDGNVDEMESDEKLKTFENLESLKSTTHLNNTDNCDINLSEQTNEINYDEEKKVHIEVNKKTNHEKKNKKKKKKKKEKKQIDIMYKNLSRLNLNLLLPTKKKVKKSKKSFKKEEEKQKKRNKKVKKVKGINKGGKIKSNKKKNKDNNNDSSTECIVEGEKGTDLHELNKNGNLEDEQMDVDISMNISSINCETDNKSESKEGEEEKKEINEDKHEVDKDKQEVDKEKKEINEDKHEVDKEKKEINEDKHEVDKDKQEVDKEKQYNENINIDNIIYNENNSFGNNNNSFFNSTSPLKTQIINEEENSLNEMKEDINEYVEMENKLDKEKIKDSERICGKIEVDNKMISPINRHNFYLTILEGMNKNFPMQWNKNNINLSKNQGHIYKGRKEKKRKRSYKNDEKLLDHSILNDINMSDKLDERNELSDSIKSNSTTNNVLETIKYDNRKKIKENDTHEEIIKYDNFTSKYNNKSSDIQFNGGIYINKFKISLDVPINKFTVSSNLGPRSSIRSTEIQPIQKNFFNNFKMNINLYCIRMEPHEKYSSYSLKKNLVVYIDKGEKINILINISKTYEKGDFFYIPRFSNFQIINDSRCDCVLYVCPLI
ncbi:schizont egress antigen-1 [Plasmodium sp. DRC-Itaito]|nr:schizont egress antigen-1 [Plasmodium sp. DRC-Itaito]